MVSCGSSRPEEFRFENRPVANRKSFDPRERPVASGFSLIRLDDADHAPEYSPDSPAVEGASRAFEFGSSAGGWTFPNGGTPPTGAGGLAWNVTRGREGIVSPRLDIAFRDLRAIEVVIAATAGQRMRLWWSRGDKFDDDKFSIGSEIQTGPETQRYVVKTSTLNGYEGLRLAHLRLDPTDGASAKVRVLGIRLVGREGLYAGRGHGIAQESLSNQVRHVVFNRAPSRITWKVLVPERSRLEVGCGLLDARQGAAFTVSVEDGGKIHEVASARVAEDDRWYDLSADLSPWAGRTVQVALSVVSPTPGQLVLWSNPLIAPAPIEAEKRRPNVLVYLVDTLRADHLGTYGHRNATSPAIDRLAAEGVLFEHCASAAAWTRPSVASLLTSLAPPSHGITRAGLAVSDGVVTLAEQMRQAGYITAGFLTSTHAGMSANMQQGYDFLFEMPAVIGTARLIVQGLDKDFSKKNSVFVNRVFFDWLGRYADQPLFLYLHTIDPHAPYEPPAPYDRMFATGYTGPVDGSHDPARGFRTARTEAELNHVRSLYDGDIRCNDDQIGELTKELDRRNLLARTLLVVTSDHGEEFFEHGNFEHSRSLHAELTRVPLVMRLPGLLPAGRRVAVSVSALDVMPTILEIAGLTPNPDVQGKSLLPEMTGKDGERTGQERLVYSWRQNRKGEEEVSVEREPLKAIWSVRGTIHLYDHTADPLEQRDLARERREEAAVFAGQAKAWLLSRSRIRSEGASGAILVDAREREWLEALGYLK